MRSHYVHLKGDIFIRLDYFFDNSISIVKRSHIASFLDEPILVFPSMVSNKFTGNGRTKFKNTLINHFFTEISKKEIEDAIEIMEIIMQNAFEAIESGDGKITLITGAPRLYKTTAAFKMAFTYKTNIIIYVSRTIKTSQQTVETVINHLPILKDIPITPIIGNIHACKRAKEIYEDAGYIAASMYCRTCGNQYTLPKRIDTPIQMTPDKITEICEEENACPKKFIRERIAYFKAIGSKQILTMHYARLKYDISDYVPLGDHVAIFDEARHLPEIAIIKSIKLNKTPTKSPHKKIKDDYIADTKKINFSMLSTDNEAIIENARNDWCQNISDGKEFTGNYKIRKVLKEFYELTNGPDAISFIGSPTRRSSFKDFADQINFITLLDHANGNNICIEDNIIDSDEKNSINLVIRNMEKENVESRYNFHLLMASGKQTFLVDSTPFPEEYRGFWLGAEYKFNLEIDIPTKYEFNIVIENRHRSIKQTYAYPDNTIPFIEIITGLNKIFKMEVFSSSIREGERLKEHNISCKYARGSEVEGVQSDKEYTLITRVPRQNPNSEKYRENTIIKMNNANGNHKEYIDIKAYAELLQMSFRTASKDKSSGSFWMSTKDDFVYKMKSYWPWLNDMLFVTLPSHREVPEKIDYAVKGLLLKKENNGKRILTLSEAIIAKKIIEFFRGNPNGSVNTCLDFVGGSRNKAHKVLKYLRDAGMLKIDPTI